MKWSKVTGGKWILTCNVSGFAGFTDVQSDSLTQ